MKLRTTHLLQVIAAASLICAAGNTADADTIVWDPDGSGNASTLNLSGWQFASGNSLFQGAIPFTLGNTFQLVFHAQLTSVLNQAGTQVNPTGLNAPGPVGGVAPYEITVVGSLTEVITAADPAPGQATYQLSVGQSQNAFVEIYFDGNQNANPLLGTGYNDGKLILQGVPIAVITGSVRADASTFSFANPQPSPAPNFDAFGTNDYSGVTSLTGLGITKVFVEISYIDPTFFVAPSPADTGRQLQFGDIITLNLSQAAPFDNVDPSQKFVSAANNGPGDGPPPTTIPAIGSTNGESGPDLQTQTSIGGFIGIAGTPSPTPSTTPAAGNARVTVHANRKRVREGNDAIITFRYKGLPLHSDIAVNYSVGGNAVLNGDYTLSGVPGQVIIPSTSDSASIVLHAVVDNLGEGHGEAAKIFVEPGAGYDVPTQKDGQRISIEITSPRS